MSNRPPALCNIKKGKALGAQDNFADTFNWMTSCIDNLQGGTGIKVDWPSTDTPQISLDSDYLGGGGGGGGGGTGEVTITGTDGSSATGSNIQIVSAADSNVTATVSDDGNGNITLTLGVYWT